MQEVLGRAIEEPTRSQLSPLGDRSVRPAPDSREVPTRCRKFRAHPRLSSAGVRGTRHATPSIGPFSEVGELVGKSVAWAPSTITPHSHVPSTSPQTDPSNNSLMPLLWCARLFTAD